MNHVSQISVTFNRGNRAGFKDVMRVLENPGRGHDAVAFACLQEMYDQQKVLDRIDQTRDWEVIRGNLPGATANPLVYRPDVLELLEPICFQLLPAGRRPRNRLGKHNMEKNFVGGRFHHKEARRVEILGSVHNIQTQGMPGRRGPALNFTKTLVDGLDKRKVVTMVGGDWNTIPSGRSLRPVRRRWRYDHLVLGEIATAKKRAIDGWAIDDKDGPERVVFLRCHWVRGIGNSDHRPLYLETGLKPRPRQ